MARNFRIHPATGFIASTGFVTFAFMAQAQTVAQSPFAKRSGPQAWEQSTPESSQSSVSSTQTPSQTAQTPVSTYVPPANAIYGTYQQPSSAVTMPRDPQSPAGSSAPQAPNAPLGMYGPGDYQPGTPQGAQYSAPTTNAYGHYGIYTPDQVPQPRQTQSRHNQGGQSQTGQRPENWGNANPRSANRGPFSNIVTTVSGFLKLGAAATDRDSGWGEDFIVDGLVRGEVSAVSQNGLEYGAGVKLRGQYDKYRRGFGGRVGDCPPTLAGCPTVTVNGTATAVRGHTSQFYASGPDNAKKAEYALEGAYLFLRSGYGDVTVGRDDGAAYLFSLGAPSLLAVGASNSPVDYTGLDSVKTVNEASGFSEKVTYTSPRLLGDSVGIGIQFGASYALNARACGVDYCVRKNGDDVSGALAPDMDDVFEVGLALDRKFDNGLSVEGTVTYAVASEQSELAVFDDLKSLGLGLEFAYHNWTLGGSYLDSNNGLQDGDYSAYDLGLTWKPSQLGFTLGYGHAEDDNVNLTSDQGVFGISYDWNENVRLGTGVQYIERQVQTNAGGLLIDTDEKATSIFVEGRFTF